MVKHKTLIRSIFLLIVTSTFLLTNQSLAYLYDIEVLGRIIQMPDGTEKVDVAIVGSDMHGFGTVMSQTYPADRLISRLDPKENNVELFLEEIRSSSYVRTFSAELKAFLDQSLILKSQNIRRNRDFDEHFSEDGFKIKNNISLISYLMLEPEARNKFLNIFNPTTLFDGITITNVECRLNTLLPNENDLQSSTPEELVSILNKISELGLPDLFAQVYSSENFNKVRSLLETWEQSSESLELASIFSMIKVKFDELRALYFQPQEALILSGAKGSSYDGLLNFCVQSCKNNPDEQLAPFLIKWLNQFNEVMSKTCLHMLEAKTLWHISQAQNRPSNRTISLMGGLHVNLQKSSEFENSSYDVSLVTSLKKIGYSHLASLNIKEYFKKENTPVSFDDMTQFSASEFVEFAAVAINFMIKWTQISDHEVHDMLSKDA